jgi:hypothetical protein
VVILLFLFGLSVLGGDERLYDSEVGSSVIFACGV